MQDADIAGGAQDAPQDGKENDHVPQVRTHGPLVNFLMWADDYEYCSPSIVGSYEIVLYVKDEGETTDAKGGYERPGRERRGST